MGERAGELGEGLARPAGEVIAEGLSVVIAGPPNAGKSTLIHALAQRELAIVSPVAGTTRDVIETPLALDGIELRFSDTAGQRGQWADAIADMGIAQEDSSYQVDHIPQTLTRKSNDKEK